MTIDTDNNDLQSLLQLMKFKKIGEYISGGRKVEDGIKISERLTLVYILTTNQKIMYVGKTKQGYRRPLNYLSNTVMKHVNDGLKTENKVDVYARIFEPSLEFEGMILNLYSSYEEELITRFDPLWNKDKPKSKKLETAE
jgi:hypothetical protein